MHELIRPLQSGHSPRVAVIDFDGTLSLIRSGWVEIMLEIMLDVLRPLRGSNESDEDLTALVTDIALNLNGRPTVFQMEQMVNSAIERGGRPESPEHYTQLFLVELLAKAKNRIARLLAGEIKPDDLLVPGARAMLEDLSARGVKLTIASGTPQVDVRREAEYLGIAHFFEGRIYGPGDDPRAFAKIDVMRQQLADAAAEGSELLGFGDGSIETQNAKELGGIAIGCATDEANRSGKVENWKRDRLIDAGADVIVADYHNWAHLSELLFPKQV